MADNKVTKSITIPEELEYAVKDLAKEKSRSFSNMVTILLEKALREE